MLGNQACSLDGLLEKGDDRKLIRAADARALADALPSRLKNLVHPLLRGEVSRDLLFRQDCLEVTYQVGRADDLLAELLQHLHRSCIDHRDIHDRVARRILHRDLRQAIQHGGQPVLQFLPRAVLLERSRQCIQAATLDAMYQLARLALRGDEVVPAPCNMRILIKAQDAIGQRITMVMVIKQPSIEAGVTQRQLDGFEVHACPV